MSNDPRKQPVYISVDAEFDGPEPVNNSMMSLGAVAYRADGKEIGRFYANMLPLPGHEESANVSEGFWQQHPDAFSATQVDRRDPGEVMAEFAKWSGSFTGVPTLVAQPLAVEDKWLTAYAEHFDVELPFKEKICMRDTLLDAMELLGRDEPCPAEWLSDHPYTHIAIDDAQHQGETFINIIRWVQEKQAAQGQSR